MVMLIFIPVKSQAREEISVQMTAELKKRNSQGGRENMADLKMVLERTNDNFEMFRP